jgi:hypothetical protein
VLLSWDQGRFGDVCRLTLFLQAGKDTCDEQVCGASASNQSH